MSSSSTMSSSSSIPARMDMSSMNNVFYGSSSTPLYSMGWVPASTGSYAGTCIFLIILAIAFRCMFAGKHILEHRWMDKDLNRRYVAVRGVPKEVERIEADNDSKNGFLITERGVEEHVKVVKRHTRTVMPWRLSVDLPRAVYVTVMVGVGYLL